MRSGITWRWFSGSLLLTIVILVASELFFIHSYTTSYYDGVEQTMQTRFAATVGQLAMYQGETDDETASLRSLALRRMVEQFSDKDQYEFMLLDASGEVISSSSGTAVEGIVTDSDFIDAQTDSVGIAIYVTSTGEEVMSVCALVPYAAEDVVALRYVTSLTLVNEALESVFQQSLIVVAIVFLISVFSGLYFVSGIVRPLRKIEAAAAAIARGDLDSRLPQKKNMHDEINRLCISINQMAKGLAETERMKSDFISSVSHELRTPLTSIKGWLETIQTIDDPTNANYRKGLAIIDTETDRLYAMVEELLDFSRLQNGSFKVDNERLDLVAELTDAVIFSEARIAQEGLKLEYHEPTEAIAVYADPNHLHQVFVNVIDNAIKYSAYGGKLTIKIWTGKEKAFIEIIDQGRGIPPEELQQVKSRFFKGKNAVRGSGIGLALVEEIMMAFDGTIDLASTLGRGTVVTLGLPLASVRHKEKLSPHAIKNNER